MTDTAPVDDWTTDYNIFDAGYINDPVPVWKEIRESGCPIAHTDRWGESFLPTSYDDVQALAKMLPELSSRDPLVVRPVNNNRDNDEVPENYGGAPPISADGDQQYWTRRLLLPHFAPKAVEAHREFTEKLCNDLIDGFIDSGTADAAGGYAQQIPPRVIAHLLGINEDRVEEFVWWVRNVLEFGLTKPELRVEYSQKIRDFFREEIENRRESPRDDLISSLANAEAPDGGEIPIGILIGMCNLQLVAGIDTTWSSLGSSLWHLAGHPDDRRRLVEDPDVFPLAIEELLRFYSPVTMAREVIADVDYHGVKMCPGDKVLMNFPAANRDPEVFENPDEFVIDRARNRHVAFGAGVHRCAGSNLARLEMDVALRTWMRRIPEFELSAPDEVTWAGGQVRGPRYVPVTFPT